MYERFRSRDGLKYVNGRKCGSILNSFCWIILEAKETSSYLDIKVNQLEVKAKELEHDLHVEKEKLNQKQNELDELHRNMESDNTKQELIDIE